VSGAGNSWTITRGFDGTVAALHLGSSLVAGFIDAWHHNALVAEVQAMQIRLGPNLSRVNTSPVVPAAPFNFSAQAPGGSLVVGTNLITLSPVPEGVNGTDTFHYLYISGGTGAAEVVPITGGTAVAGAASGTIFVTCANAHSGAWTIRSATAGIQEAISSIGPTHAAYAGDGATTGGGTVYIAPGTYTLFGTVYVPSNVELFGILSSTILVPGTPGMNMVQTVPRSLYNRVHDMTFNLQGISSNALVLMSSQLGRYWNLQFQGGNGVVGIDLYMTVSGSADTTYNCILNDFNNIHFEIGTLTPLVLMGAMGPSGAVTENTFRNIWVAGGGATHSLITVDKMADSNYWYNINFLSGTALLGFDIGPTSNPGDAGGQYIDYVVATGANPGSTIINVGPGQNNVCVNTIINLGWGTEFFASATARNVVIKNSRYPADGYSIWATGGLHLGETQNPTFLATPSFGASLTNGLNSNIAIGQTTFLYVQGPTAAFSLGGFAGGVDGRTLQVFCSMPQAMTIVNEDATSIAANRIATLTGVNVTLRAGISFATFIYAAPISRWLLVSTN
jgi:hypothetical protein